ncbi:uncharacterized protein LOC121399387 isoform X1 [Xenopus laevis]|uniref:1-alkyl-2-acetylglycerophosphocholine esterase n=2 Tax=Xenopus laevis TaxID=8355 RepID=A0A8J1M3M4_XENLA|nr:uncharacterized protein LOC121399387 isoform X1 [Xenopus laevis]
MLVRRLESRMRPGASPPIRRRDVTGQGRTAPMSAGGQAQGDTVITAQVHRLESGEHRVGTPTGRRGWSREPKSANRRTAGGTRQGRDFSTPTKERSPGARNRGRSRSRDSRLRGRREHSYSSVRSSRRGATAHACPQGARISRCERSSRSPSRSHSHRDRHSCCHLSCRNSPRITEREASQARSVTSNVGTRRRRSASHDRVQPGTIQNQPPTKSNRLSSNVTTQSTATAGRPGVGAFSGSSTRSITAALPISTAALAAGNRRLLELVKASLAGTTWTAYGKAWEEWKRLNDWAGGLTSREDRRAGLIWYVVWLTEQGKSAAFIDKRMAGLAFHFKLRGKEDLTKEFMIRQALKGLRKSKHSKDTRRPISFDLLTRLQAALDHCCYTGYEAALFKAAFALAFFGAFRVGCKTVVWLLGHSYVSRAQRRAAVKKRHGRQLGFPEGRISIQWFGFPGLQWSGVWPALLRLAKAGSRPDILVIHAGGNDLGLVAQRELVAMMKRDVDRIRSMFPGIILVWSEMIPRSVWRYARDLQAIERSRGKVNKLLSIFIRKSGGVVVRHRDLEAKLVGYLNNFDTDGVHLSDIGMDLFNMAIADGIERALELFDGGSRCA